MKLFVVAVCFCFGAGGGPVSFGVGCETVFVFVLGRAGGQSALELGVKLFVVAVCFCFGAGGGPVSFGVGCETVRRRRLFLFWGGRGASQLWSWV